MTHRTRYEGRAPAVAVLLGLVLAALVSLTLVGRACAQDSRPIPTALDGRPGLWFPLEEGRRAIAALAEVQGARTQLRLLEDQLVLARGELELAAQAIAAGREAEARLAEALHAVRGPLDALEVQAARAQGERDVWMGLAGGAAAIAVILGVVLAAIAGS